MKLFIQVALGTVTNIDEAVEWLSYTYLFVRMRINPQVNNIKNVLTFPFAFSFYTTAPTTWSQTRELFVL